jgi:hypothetical protein
MSSGNGNNGHGNRADLEALLAEAADAQAGSLSGKKHAPGSLHPAWEVFIRYCQQVGHGELERVKIQDGLPVLAEVATRKVRFS